MKRLLLLTMLAIPYFITAGQEPIILDDMDALLTDTVQAATDNIPDKDPKSTVIKTKNGKITINITIKE